MEDHKKDPPILYRLFDIILLPNHKKTDLAIHGLFESLLESAEALSRLGVRQMDDKRQSSKCFFVQETCRVLW